MRFTGILRALMGLAMALTAVSARAASQKTVCSITINSDDEIKAMQATLSPKDFRFIELTQFGDDTYWKRWTDFNGNAGSSRKESPVSSQSNWLRRSCEVGIQCDILVVSGHFGGAFFGSSQIRLPLETMEESACEDACSGIFNRPKEVFLFGCNTLAGKDRDTRTPEQYMNVLMADGFSASEAQQVVAYRYSPIGHSFHDRMSRVFATVPRVYGFSSVAPIGARNAPLLNQYLKKVGPRYSSYISTIGDQKNQDLLTAFRSTAMAQTKGSERKRSPVCYINDPATTTLAKLQYVHELLRKGGLMEMAPYLVNYFKKLDRNQLTTDEKQVLASIQNDRSAAQILEPLIRTALPGLIKPQIDIMNLMLTLGWMNQTEYESLSVEFILHQIESSSVSLRTLRDQVCSLDIELASLNPKRIPETLWSNANFYKVIECLKPRNAEAALDLIERYKKNRYLESVILHTMAQARITHPQVTAELFARLESTTNDSEFREIIWYLERTENNSPEVIETLLRVLERVDGTELAKWVRSAILSLSGNRAELIRLILNKGLMARTPEQARAVFSDFWSLSSTHEQFFTDEVQAALLNPKSVRHLENAIMAISKLGLRQLDKQEILKKIVNSKRETPLRLAAFEAMSQQLAKTPQELVELCIHEQDPQMMAKMLELIDTNIATLKSTIQSTQFARIIARAQASNDAKIKSLGNSLQEAIKSKSK